MHACMTYHHDWTSGKTLDCPCHDLKTKENALKTVKTVGTSSIVEDVNVILHHKHLQISVSASSLDYTVLH